MCLPARSNHEPSVNLGTAKSRSHLSCKLADFVGRMKTAKTKISERDDDTLEAAGKSNNKRGLPP